MLKKIRQFLSVFLLLLGVSYASFYIYNHRALFKPLGHTNIYTLISVYVLNIVMFFVLVLVLIATLVLCGLKINIIENIKLNAHSMIVNFFIPGQGGPAYRGAYLYKIHNLKVKKYILATLIYYGIYALISFLFLFMFNLTIWQTLLIALFILLISYLVIKRFTKTSHLKTRDLTINFKTIGLLFIATLIQLIIQAVIYGVELHTINSKIHLTQVITYTGAANLALFVSLTPAAIGIRESFLIFSKKLHHISTANIISANIIDRSVFIVFLLTLAGSISIYHLYVRLSKNRELESNNKLEVV